MILGPPLKSTGDQNGTSNLNFPVFFCKNALVIPGVEGFFRDMFPRSFLAVRLDRFGSILASFGYQFYSCWCNFSRTCSSNFETDDISYCATSIKRQVWFHLPRPLNSITLLWKLHALLTLIFSTSSFQPSLASTTSFGSFRILLAFGKNECFSISPPFSSPRGHQLTMTSMKRQLWFHIPGPFNSINFLWKLHAFMNLNFVQPHFSNLHLLPVPLLGASGCFRLSEKWMLFIQFPISLAAGSSTCNKGFFNLSVGTPSAETYLCGHVRNFAPAT